LEDKMSRIPKLKVLPILFISTLLVSCLGTNVKTLGTKDAGGTGTSSTDSDSFSITLAYRNTASNGRVVLLQGVRDIASASLSTYCGTTGASCQCLFYTSTTDTSPVASTSNGISTGNNSYSCSLPSSVPDASLNNYQYVRLETTDATRQTGFIGISTSLTLSDVIGDLDQSQVRGIFKYGCVRTFFEGEGVSASQVTCPTTIAQQLGLITANYNYYLWKSSVLNNFTSIGTTTAYSQPICNRQFNQLTCDGPASAVLEWGLYAVKTGIFQVGITMTASPNGQNATSVYGYVALPDTAGNCPTGLIKVRPWMAVPGSIVQGSIDGTNPPSSFVNSNGSLNNTVVEQSQPTPFVVDRQKNQTTCNISGDCTGATFAGVTQVQANTYTGLTPVVCAIPKELLSGLF
jgi:hypothetical protein